MEQTNATASLNVIIPEVLKEDNYKRWSILMRHYFVAQGLWDVVLSSQIPWSEDPGDWTKKNALALLAIKMSCGAETFDQIEKMDSARDAWNALADLHKPPNVDGHRGSETDAAGLISSANWIQPGMLLGNYQRADEFVSLLKDIYAGNWNALKSLDRITEIIFPNGLTVLHMATIAGRLKIVNQLVKIAREDYLEMQDDNGDTALSLATSNGEKKIAECLVQKNDKLLTIRNKEGYIPLVVACSNRKKNVSSYLYSVTPFEFLLPKNSNQGTLFLKHCVLNFMFDVGLDLFLRCPQLAASTRESITISELSEHPSLFRRRSERLLDKCVCIAKVPYPSEVTDRSRKKIFGRHGILHVAWIKVIGATLPIIFVGRPLDLYNRKLTHTFAKSVLRYWCKEISTYRDATQLVERGTISAIFQAIKNGRVKIVI